MDQFKQVAALVKVGIPAQNAAAIVRATVDAFALRRSNPATALEHFDAVAHTLAIAANGGMTDAQAVAVVEVLRDAITEGQAR